MPSKEFMETQTGTVKERGKKVFMTNFVQRSRDKIRRTINERVMVRQNRIINPAEDPDRKRSNTQRRMQAEMDAELFGNMSAATANRPATTTLPATTQTRPVPILPSQTTLISAASAAATIRASAHANPAARPQHRRGNEKASVSPAVPNTSSDSDSSPPPSPAAAEVAALRRKYAHVNRGFWPAAARELVEAVEAEEERAERCRSRAGRTRKAAKERGEMEKKATENGGEKRKRVVEDEEEESEDDEPVIVPKRKLRRVGRLVGRS
ncbi:hypothetical protein SLS56_004624 [Neofusicoccum ribis]|uniref:Uncharacterized protein n=1 Tax=Neofusicoccum ribis TaxID=45134 RepID=A0ABR3SWS6_9PEZI